MTTLVTAVPSTCSRLWLYVWHAAASCRYLLLSSRQDGLPGFMETYGFTDMSIRAVDFTIGTWPILIIVPLWALFIGPKFTPKTPVVPIEALEKRNAGKQEQKLSPVVDKIGIAIFLWYDLMPDFFQPASSYDLVCCIDRKPPHGSVWCCRPEIRPA